MCGIGGIININNSKIEPEIDNNIIEQISEDRFLFSTPNLISREEILRILKKNMCYNNKQYKILSILKFVVDLEPEEIKDFLKNDNDKV